MWRLIKGSRRFFDRLQTERNIRRLQRTHLGKWSAMAVGMLDQRDLLALIPVVKLLNDNQRNHQRQASEQTLLHVQRGDTQCGETLSVHSASSRQSCRPTMQTFVK